MSLSRAVHQARPFVGAEAERVEHGVEVAARAAAALHRQARRLVEGEHVVVAVDHAAPQRLGVGGVDGCRGWPGPGRRLVAPGRQAHRIPRRQPRATLGAPAADAHLPGAQPLLQAPGGDLGAVPPEPTVKAEPRLLGRHDYGADFAHHPRHPIIRRDGSTTQGSSAPAAGSA